MKLKHLLFTAILCATAMMSSPTYAYKLVDAKAVTLTDTTTLFTLTFSIGFLNRDTLVPIAANSSYARDISYEIIDKTTNQKTPNGNGTGIVLSDAEIKNNHYFVPRGKNGTFTIVSLYTHPTPAPRALTVTALPFDMIDTTTIVKASVPSTTLTSFATPFSQ